MMDEALQLLIQFLGNGICFVLGIFFMIYWLNYGYIHLRGIKKLDAYFENGKDYDDTFTISAIMRFGKYCREFIRGRLRVEEPVMRKWMCFNAVGYILTAGCIVIMSFLYFYLKISSWLS